METLDLAPAQWIWLPSQRTLSNTVVLFRKAIHLESLPRVAKGWILADSRYRLWVNGERVQWGPAPFDPRHGEADPIDLAKYFKVGENLISVEVLFFGHGEGTWPTGKPGLLLHLNVDGQRVVTDSSWQCAVDRGHKPGQFKRWFLRSLQEEFDARLRPRGFMVADPSETWVQAQVSSNPPTRSAFASSYWNYAEETWMVDPSLSTLRARSVPMLREPIVRPQQLVGNNAVDWKRDADDWFEFRMPGAFSIEKRPGFDESLSLVAEAGILTFSFEEGMVGWPLLQLEAPAGTIVEVMVHESWNPEKNPWLDTHFFEWSRFICEEGLNTFEPFDFEAFRLVQLHVRRGPLPGRIMVKSLAARRRVFPWPHQPQLLVRDAPLQRLFEAAFNTLNNCAQDTIVDGMARERQQYSGDGSHQLHAIRLGLGETRLPARFLRTFCYGQGLDGAFMDSWPAWDRLARTWERQIGASGWGPLLDHGVGFCFDNYHHWMQTGDLSATAEPYPFLTRFLSLLESLPDSSGLIPVEGLGMPAVWMDHIAFKAQRDKRLAFNLYASAMLLNALKPLAEAHADEAVRDRCGILGSHLLESCLKHYWDDKRELFINNLPTERADGEPRVDDRSLATAIIYDQAPKAKAMVDLLADPTAMLGLSYPANAIWRYWALIKTGRIRPVLADLGDRWAKMPSVLENNTIQENWTVTPGSPDLYSHCAVAPLIVAYQGLMGLSPRAPGFQELQIRPQLDRLNEFEATAYIPSGAVHLRSVREADHHQVTVLVPRGVKAWFIESNGGEALIPTGAETNFVLNASR